MSGFQLNISIVPVSLACAHFVFDQNHWVKSVGDDSIYVYLRVKRTLWYRVREGRTWSMDKVLLAHKIYHCDCLMVYLLATAYSTK